MSEGVDMKLLTWKKKTAVITAMFVAVGGAAFGFWTAGGAGDGTATTGTAADVVINQTSVVTAMGPGVAAQPLSGTFTSAKPVYVSQVTASVTGTSNAGCTSSDFTIVQPTATNAEVTTGSTWGGGSIAFNNKPAVNQDACQNVTVDIAYTSV
jgi:hypothetical protein